MKAMTWPIRKVASIADMDPRILHQWFATRMLHYGREDLHSLGIGIRSGLSRPRVIEATTLRLLTRWGLMASRSANAVRKFTIEGNNGREPCELFPLGKTALVLNQTDAEVVNLDPDARVFSDLSNNGVSIVVDMNAIVERVDTALAKL
jgi:hypothetical protein